MILHVYTIFDGKAGTYHTPFFAHNDEVAKRHIRTVCGEDTELARHHADFSLYRLGQWDDGRAIFETQLPDIIANVTELWVQAQRDNHEARQIKLAIDDGTLDVE